MTRPSIEQLWDDYRDGTLTEEQRGEFERWLKANEPASALWQAESQWLAMMAAEQAEAKPQGLPGAKGDFAAAVLARWEAPARQGGAVLARIGWRRWTGVAVSIAAAVVLALTLSMWSTWFGSQPAPVTPTGPDVAVAPPTVAPSPAGDSAGPDAIGVLFASAGDTYAAAAAQPARIRQALSDTASMLDIGKLAALLDPFVPDPARFVEPTPQPRG